MITKTFEYPVIQRVSAHSPVTEARWLAFLDRCTGSCADAPLERGEQGQYEKRDELL